MTVPDQPLSKTLEDFTATPPPGALSVGDVTAHFRERSIAFFLFLCALPAAVPLPGLGINLIIAGPLLLLTLQQMTLRPHIWLPERLARKSISQERLLALTSSLVPWVKRAEAISRPRLSFITGDALKPLIGLLGFVMALSVCIPLPLTNTVPSMGIALMALGIIMKDGLAVLGGALIGTLWIALIAFTVIFLGVEGIDVIKDTIKSIF